MSSPGIRALPGRLIQRDSLQADLARAARATVAFMVPLLLAAFGRLSIEVSFIALVAQNIALVDVRGAYALRLGLLLAMTVILAASAGLGALCGAHLGAALACTAAIAIGGGLWRHLSSDYGASLAISSTLVFLLGLNSPGAAAEAAPAFMAALGGGLWGVTLQVLNWPFRPQHPLRRTAAESWLAVADLFEALAPATDGGPARTARIAEQETALRAALDKTAATLAAAGASRPRPIHRRLEDLNLAAARLATRVAAFNTAFAGLRAQPDFAAVAPAFVPALTALTNLARTIALAVVSRQPAHLATADVRRRRLTNLLRTLQARLSAPGDGGATRGQLVEILRQIEDQLGGAQTALRATMERAEERAAFSLELFDLHTWTLRPLASALNLSARFDPALVRFTGRIAVLTMLGVFAFKRLGLPHGYWLPFTMVVVLQPDYGSTRQRAAQRVLGTVTGSVLASVLLILHLPFAALAATMAATIFIFGFFVKRDYGIAVIFITLFVVLLTEASGPVTFSFALERVGSTLAGGALALLAALFFWPVWERDRLPPVLAGALRANRAFLQALGERLAEGRGYDPEAVAAKRRAEAANGAVFSSLRRMMGDPKNRREGLEQAAALANGNQRVTRALTVVTLHLTPGDPLREDVLARFCRLATDALETLAVAAETGAPPAKLDPLLSELERFQFPLGERRDATASGSRDLWVFSQFTQIAAELSAMLLSVSQAPAAD